MTVDVNKDYNDPILAEDDGTLRVKGWNSDGDCDILPDSLIGKTKFTTPGATAARSNAERWNDFISAKDRGATFDGSTDDTDKIQLVLDYAGNNGIGCVRLPRGIGRISDTLHYKKGIALIGDGKRASRLQAVPGSEFSDGFMLLPGDAGGMGFDNFLSHFQLDCNDVAGLSGLKYTSPQEGCGSGWGLLITGFRDKGIDLSNAPANCYLNDIEVWGSKLGANVGIDIKYGSQIFICKATVLGDYNSEDEPAAQRTLTTGIQIELSETIIGLAWHFETCVGGVLCIGDNVSGVVNGVNASAAGTGPEKLIRNTGAPKMVFCSVQRNNSPIGWRNDYGDFSVTDAFIQSTIAGTSVVTPHSDLSPSGSPFSYYNNTHQNQCVYIIGGTVSSVAVVGRTGDSETQIGTGPGTYVIVPGELLKVTYSVAPTIRRFPI